MSGLIITSDRFAFLDITEMVERMLNIGYVGSLLATTDVYAYHSDETESLLESVEEIEQALEMGLKIVIEAGHLPPLDIPFKKASKILHEGYWYVKIDDITKSNSVWTS